MLRNGIEMKDLLVIPKDKFLLKIAFIFEIIFSFLTGKVVYHIVNLLGGNVIVSSLISFFTFVATIAAINMIFLKRKRIIGGVTYYFKLGTFKNHKVNGPAIVSEKMVMYFVNNKQCRIDGPATILPTLGMIKYYKNDNEMNETEYFKMIGK